MHGKGAVGILPPRVPLAGSVERRRHLTGLEPEPYSHALKEA